MKAAIFDMDGTLLDTMALWYTLGRDYLIGKGLSTDDPFVRGMAWLPSYEAAETIALRDPFQEGLTKQEIIRTHFYPMLAQRFRTQAVPMPGAMAYLERLAAQGIPCCVVTATPLELALPALSSTGVLPFLRFVRSERTFSHAKHDPACFIAVAHLLGQLPCDCTVHDDALYALRGAKAAGCRVIALENPAFCQNPAEVLDTCDRLVPSFVPLLSSLSES